MIDYSKPLVDEDGSPIKIAEIASHHCIRCVKKANAFKKLGYEIYGAGDTDPYGIKVYDAYFVWKTKQQLQNVIKLLIDYGVRLFTWNNEPHEPAMWIRETINSMGVQDKVKLIVDCHDLEIIRRAVGTRDELGMISSADGLIYVSQPIQGIVNNLYRVTVPTTVIYSYCNLGIVEYEGEKIKERKGLIYEGGANPPDDQELNSIFPYRNLYNIIKQLVDMGSETYMICGNLTAYDTYQSTGAILTPPMMYEKMMNQLIKHKYGILIFNNEDGKQDQVNFTLTNKEEEYLQAGLPSLACWCPESMKHVAKHKIGFTFEHIDQIGDCSQLDMKYWEVMGNIKTKRVELVMENFIIKLENLYATVLGIQKKGMPAYIKKIHEFEYGKEDTAQTLN